MSVDRAKGPDLSEFGELLIPEPMSFSLDNGISGQEIRAGEEEVIKLDVLFSGGSVFQPAPLIAAATAALITEGTKTKSAREVAEYMDFHGAFLSAESGKDFATVSLVCLKSHFEPMLVLLSEILNEPRLGEEEFGTWLARSRQSWLIDQEKVGVLASRTFRNMVFPQDHPYYSELSISSFDAITPDQVKDFYQKSWRSRVYSVVVSGKTDEQVIGLLNKVLGSDPSQAAESHSPSVEPNPHDTNKILVEKDHAIQSAIRVGRSMINRTHEEYNAMSILGTVLGGYFGSRLMKNIREDKGYTYGIGGGVIGSLRGAFFVVSTETGADVTTAALTEIYGEIEKLSTDLVPDYELDTVKNYLLGSIVRSMDGLFALSDIANSLQGYGLGFDFYRGFEQKVRAIDSNELRELARKYLNVSQLSEVVAGQKK